MERTFTTTADDETALTGLGLTFDAVVRHHLNVIQSNYVDSLLAKAKADAAGLPMSDQIAALTAANTEIASRR